MHIEDCEVSTSGDHIAVMCTYFSNSTATGFQIIAHLNDIDKAHILHSNRTMDRHTPGIVQVEENGLYQVTILAITGGLGILESTVEYSEELMVNIQPATTECM